jgi:hypothetical protein
MPSFNFTLHSLHGSNVDLVSSHLDPLVGTVVLIIPCLGRDGATSLFDIFLVRHLKMWYYRMATRLDPYS